MKESPRRLSLRCKQVCSTSVFATSPLDDALEGVAKLGYNLIDLLVFEGWAHLNPSALRDDSSIARTTAEKLKKRKLKCVALNVGFGRSCATFDEAIHAENVELFKAVVALAEECGADIITLSAGAADEAHSLDECLERAARNFRDLNVIAKENNITLTVETHSDTLAENPRHAVRIIEKVPGLMITLDPSHFVKAGIDLDECERLMKYTAHVHLRNAVTGDFQARMDEGTLDFRKFLAILESHNYSGYISNEYIASPRYNYDVVAEAVKLKELLAKHCLP